MSQRLWKVPTKAQRRVFAKETLLQARKCQEEQCVLEAEFLYTEGTQMLRELISEETLLPKREQYCQELMQYERQLVMLQTQLQKHLNTSQLVARYTLRDGARGHSYQTLFEPYMGDEVREVHIYEPQLCERHHFKNLVSFLEMCLKCCRKLIYVRVFTKADNKNPKNQLAALKALRFDLFKGNVTFSFRFRKGLQERKFVLGNGITIKTARGLHIYRHNESTYSLGLCDFDFRKCENTDVDVWRALKPFYEPATSSNNQPKDHGDVVSI